MTSETRVNLAPIFFGEAEKTLVESGALTASTFKYASGVSAVRLSNGLGQLILLPFQGQQIWSASMGGRELTMVSMFDEPQPTQVYLDTYGGFLLHCGATAMGVPTEADSHPLHGELPNARYQKAYLVLGQDEKGDYIGLGGKYRHTVAFSHNYTAEPVVKLYACSTLYSVTMDITNLKRTEMEFMYLAHINFRPTDHGRLVYSAPCTPEHVRVRKSIPSHVHPLPGYREFLADLEEHPEKHNELRPDLLFDPEVVFFLDYVADGEGWAHTMQVRPDGTADYVRHRPGQLDTGVRWISRTPDQDALGMILPATAEPEGYSAEKAKGNIKIIGAGETVHIDLEMGTLDAYAAAKTAEIIASLIG
jgi:hypothetical protein